MGSFVGAALVDTWRGADNDGEGVLEIVVARVVSDELVTTSVTGVLVASVTGTVIVASVVGEP